MSAHCSDARAVRLQFPLIGAAAEVGGSDPEEDGGRGAEEGEGEGEEDEEARRARADLELLVGGMGKVG